MPALTIDYVRNLVARKSWKISEHAIEEMDDDKILAEDILRGVELAEVVESYPDFPKGPCILVLQMDSDDRPIHVLWGVPAGESQPAVVVTAYRPNPTRWSADFLRRQR